MSELPVNIRFGPFVLDEQAYALRRSGELVPLEPKPMAVLLYLARNRHRVVRRAELLEAVWAGTAVSPDAVAHSLLKVREALGEGGPKGGTIETVRGVGFRFVASIEEAAPAASASETPRAGAVAALIGRRAELDELRSALSASLAGAGRLVLLAGKAGVGKTALAEALIESAQAAGAEVHQAVAWEGPGVPAFWLWVQILRGFVEQGDAADLSQRMGPAAVELARLVPGLREKLRFAQPDVTDNAEARFRLLDALACFLGQRARAAPQVLVLEDLQWGDAASIRALEFLAAGLARERVLVVATYRDDELAAGHPLHDAIAAWERSVRCVHVRVRGLAPAAVRHLVELTVGFAPAEVLISALHERTSGNPFFVKELLALAMLRPALPDDDVAAHLASQLLSIPSGVRRVASHRLLQLSPECRSVLESAAVLGREFSAAVLARDPALGREALLVALEEAVLARVIEPRPGAAPSYRFTHDVLREVIYSELSEGRRIELHRCAADALVALRAGHLAPVVPALAHHYGEAALLLGDMRAVDYSRWAGDLAREALAYEASADHFEQALRALELLPQPDPRVRAELLVCLGFAHLSAGRIERGHEVLREAAGAARAAGHPHALAIAATGFSELGVGAVDAEAVALLEEAIHALGEERSFLWVSAAALLSVHVVNQPGRLREARALIDQAEAVSRSLEAPNALGAVLSARAAVLRVLPDGLPAERVRVLDEALEVTRGDATAELLARLQRHGALLELGDRDAVDAEQRCIEGALARLRSPYWRYVRHALSAMRALLEGRFEEGESLVLEAFGGSENPRFTAPNLAALILAIRIEQDRTGEMLPLLESETQRFPHIVPLRAARQLCLLDAGREGEARDAFERIAADGFAAAVGVEGWSVALALLSEVAARLGDSARARTLAGLLAPRARHCLIVASGYYCHGPVALHLSRLALTAGSRDEATAHLELAFERAAALRSPVWRVHALAMQARIALAGGRGGGGSARALAREASKAAQGLGMLRVAREMAERAGGDLRP